MMYITINDNGKQNNSIKIKYEASVHFLKTERELKQENSKQQILNNRE